MPKAVSFSAAVRSSSEKDSNANGSTSLSPTVAKTLSLSNVSIDELHKATSISSALPVGTPQRGGGAANPPTPHPPSSGYSSSGSSRSGSGSRSSGLYKEDDSVDSELDIAQYERTNLTRSSFGVASPTSQSTASFPGPGRSSSRGGHSHRHHHRRHSAARRRLERGAPLLSSVISSSSAMLDSFMAGPSSYFEAGNTSAFDLRNEWNCLSHFVRHAYASIEEDRLPWDTDFLDPKKLKWPKKTKEVLSRINLNIPYYSSNYLEIFYCMAIPFLLLYNPAFLFVLVLESYVLYSIYLNTRWHDEYGDSVTILGRTISYHRLGHLTIGMVVVLFMFFDGLKTTLLTALITLSVIIPHAVWRKPTYFDDEDMEKCRPKLGQYALSLLFIVLSYLEGETSDAVENGNFKAAAKERVKLGLPPSPNEHNLEL